MNAIRSEQATIVSSGLRLFRRSVLPAGSPWAHLHLAHGYGDHSGRYVHFLNWLAARGIAAHAVDLRGHGRSDGRRGFVRVWDEYLDDLAAGLRDCPGCGPGSAPWFCFGHSHGGLLLAVALLRGRLPSQVRGCILSSPYFRSAMTVPAWKVFLAKALNRCLPWFRVASGIRPGWLSSDPAMLAEGRTDPLALLTATPRWFLTTQAVQERLCEGPVEVALPVLVLFGEDDRIASLGAAREFLRCHRLANGTLRTYPAQRHELFRDTQREAVFGEVHDWIRARATGGQPCAS
jgi:alpha-beta hydrolase superfamily lysophospholipase